MSIRKRAAAALAALLGLCVLLAILVMACAPRTETADVAILMYHAFTEDEADTGSLCTPASEFARQLSALRDAGYTSVGYADLIEFVNGDGKLPEKPLLISIDDGYQNNLDLAAPLLEKYRAGRISFDPQGNNTHGNGQHDGGGQGQDKIQDAFYIALVHGIIPPLRHAVCGLCPAPRGKGS